MNETGKWKAYIEKRPWDGYASLRIGRSRRDGSFDLVQPIQTKTYAPGEFAAPDDVALKGNTYMDDSIAEFLQAMVNLAWEEGIKPIQLEDQKNELKAVRDHLSDMRALAMKGQT